MKLSRHRLADFLGSANYYTTDGNVAGDYDQPVFFSKAQPDDVVLELYAGDREVDGQEHQEPTHQFTRQELLDAEVSKDGKALQVTCEVGEVLLRFGHWVEPIFYNLKSSILEITPK